MVREFHREQPEIMMDSIPDASARSRATKSRSGGGSAVTPAMPGRKCYRLVVMSFGLLCILQAALNISLRLLLYDKTVNMEAILKTVTEERDQLKRKLSDIDHYSFQGWIHFSSSFYYISTIRKTWTESRDDCLQRGADLMIINSREEQLFTRRLKDNMWIGLKDSKTVEKWKWVDGTPLTNRYWGPGEPNNYKQRNEECVEIKFHDNDDNWNDEACNNQNFWICEKRVGL